MRREVQSSKLKAQGGERPARAGAPSIARLGVPLCRAEQCSALRVWCAAASFAALLVFGPDAFAAAPEDLSWKPLVIPNALVVVGPWGDEFRWREALHAQGIGYDDAYRANVETVRRDIELNYPGLHLVGRNGMHKYNNQDHAMMTAMLTVSLVGNLVLQPALLASPVGRVLARGFLKRGGAGVVEQTDVPVSS